MVATARKQREPVNPADKIERWPIAKLIPFARNARLHTEEQIQQLAASIREFGWTIPVLIDPDGEIIAGHGRVMAAELVGISIVPVMIAAGWSDERKRAYRIADNKLAENARWDWSLLRVELSELAAVDYNVDLIGFSTDDLAAFFIARPGTTVGDAGDEWGGMPEFDQPDRTAFHSVIVHFKDQAAVDDFARLVGQAMSERTRFLWFPPAEIERYVDKHYAAVPDLRGEQGAVGEQANGASP